MQAGQHRGISRQSRWTFKVKNPLSWHLKGPGWLQISPQQYPTLMTQENYLKLPRDSPRIFHLSKLSSKCNNHRQTAMPLHTLQDHWPTALLEETSRRSTATVWELSELPEQKNCLGLPYALRTEKWNTHAQIWMTEENVSVISPGSLGMTQVTKKKKKWTREDREGRG